jgi:hypothetical protein
MYHHFSDPKWDGEPTEREPIELSSESSAAEKASEVQEPMGINQML